MAAAEEVRFPTEEVRQHAETVDGVGAAVREARSAVTEVTMDSQAYGVLCQFLPTVLSPVFQAAVDALNNPGYAKNFAGGRYDEVVLTEDVILYRAGDSRGEELGQWFSTAPPQSVAEVRIDTAVKPIWTNPVTGEFEGMSPVDAVYTVKIPAGATVYAGPVANQGGVHTGGGHQVFISRPWENSDVQVLGREMLP